MTKDQIEASVESIIKRLCAGVIAHNENLELLKNECDSEGREVGGFSGTSLTKYVMRCHGADIPRILGKGGERFRALRWIMALAGLKLGREIQLSSVVDCIVGTREPFPHYEFNPKWPRAEIQLLLQDTCTAIFQTSAKVSLKEMERCSVFTITCGPAEPDQVIAAVTPILNCIFNGIGVTHGAQLSIDVAKRTI